MQRSIISAMLLLAAAACDDQVTAPEVDDPQFAMAASAAGHSAADVFTFGDPPVQVEGRSRLWVNAQFARFRLRTTELEGGNAYTIWMVIFNTPEGCSDECGEDDLFNPDATVDIIYGGGRVVGRRGSAVFRGGRYAGDNSRSLFAALGVPAPGMIDPTTAEIHLIVRDHGPKIPGSIRSQIRTFEGGCTPESSFGLGDGPNECADVQFAVHLAQN